MTCPRCRCPECRAAAVNAVLGKVVSRETGTGIRDARDVPFIEAHNAQVLRDNLARDQWRDTSDPHATDLALAVAEEMRAQS